jgi:hypothetical protein
MQGGSITQNARVAQLKPRSTLSRRQKSPTLRRRPATKEVRWPCVRCRWTRARDFLDDVVDGSLAPPDGEFTFLSHDLFSARTLHRLPVDEFETAGPPGPGEQRAQWATMAPVCAGARGQLQQCGRRWPRLRHNGTLGVRDTSYELER